jgi:hypothetical protein
MGKTLEDLKAAFAGESQANRKYIPLTLKKPKQMGIRKLPGCSAPQHWARLCTPSPNSRPWMA